MARFSNLRFPQAFSFAAGLLLMLAMALLPARLYPEAGNPVVQMSFYGQIVLWPIVVTLLGVSVYAGGCLVLRSWREFRRMKKISKEAYRAKARFLRGLSERIREPMTGLVGMTDLLLNSKLAPDQKEFAGVVSDSAHSLLEMLNSLLEYARLDDGTIQAASADFDLHGLIEDAVLVYIPEAQKKKLLLACCISPAVPRVVRGDPVLLTKLLRVLLSNAVRYTKAGEVVLTARPAHSNHRQTSVCFDVSDTGIGIAQERQAELIRCDARYLAGPGETGSGFGLAIAQLIAARFHGQVDLFSEPEKGSVFWSVLRFDRTILSEARLESDPSGAELQQVCLLWRNKATRRMVVWKLATLGVSCTTVEEPAHIPEVTQVLFLEGGYERSVPERMIQVQLVRTVEEAAAGIPFLLVPLRLPALSAMLTEVAAILKTTQLAGLAGHLKGGPAASPIHSGNQEAEKDSV